MIKNKITYFLLLTSCAIFLLVGCRKSIADLTISKEDYTEYLQYTFESHNDKFTFKYHEKWTLSEQKGWDESPLSEGSPDWGVEIFCSDLGGSIYLYGSHSPSSIIYDDQFTKEEFLVNNKRIGDAYIHYADDIISIYVLYDNMSSSGYYNASGIFKKNYYKSNEKHIWNTLASLEH